MRPLLPPLIMILPSASTVMFAQWRVWPKLPTLVKVGAAPLKSICRRMPFVVNVSTLSGSNMIAGSVGSTLNGKVPIL